MKTGSKIAIGAGIAGLAILGISKIVSASNQNPTETTGKLIISISPETAILTISGSQVIPGTYPDINPGQYTYSVSADNYETKSGTFNIVAGKTTAINIILTPINVIPVPTASFTANPPSGNAPLSVLFSNMSSGEITIGSWNFGDGQTSNEVNPTHTFNNPGTYNVVLTVYGQGGNSSASLSINVFEAPPIYTYEIINPYFTLDGLYYTFKNNSIPLTGYRDSLVPYTIRMTAIVDLLKPRNDLMTYEISKFVQYSNEWSRPNPRVPAIGASKDIFYNWVYQTDDPFNPLKYLISGGYVSENISQIKTSFKFIWEEEGTKYKTFDPHEPFPIIVHRG